MLCLCLTNNFFPEFSKAEISWIPNCLIRFLMAALAHFNSRPYLIFVCAGGGKVVFDELRESKCKNRKERTICNVPVTTRVML